MSETMTDIRFFKGRDGRSIAYAVSGSGPYLVCPAWWVSHVEADWREPAFREFFEQLSEGFTLVRYDRPGVGLSGGEVGEVSLGREAEILEELIAELGLASYSLFGLSRGGPTAIAHIAKHADQVDRVCFLGTFANGGGIATKDVEHAMLAMVRAHWGIGSTALAHVFAPDVSKEALNSFARQQRAAANAEAAAQFLELTYGMNAEAHLPACTIPALVMHRSGDLAIPSHLGQELARSLPDARLMLFEGRNHVPWFGGEDIARAANAFLRGDSPVPSPVTGPAKAAVFLDTDNRALNLEGVEVALTPLEFATLQALTGAESKVMTRDQLLAEVWKQPFEGSNRIDAMIRGLRRKLGPYAASIETVIGHGYRFRGWQKAAG
tara:strand:- start:1189 stop:2328 length:1140 start_codon:yes stop_codon:yes gene_type:complete